jgi:hypothetical protein
MRIVFLVVLGLILADGLYVPDWDKDNWKWNEYYHDYMRICYNEIVD